MIAAVVAAAGRSQRMGRPKLMLPLGKTTVIGNVVEALRVGGADPVVIVVPPPDSESDHMLAREVKRAGATVLTAPERPPDMRGSVELGLEQLWRMGPPDAVLITPGDAVGISAKLVARIVESCQEAPSSIIIPTFQGRRGHPIAMPWPLAAQVAQLPAGVGINALVALRAADVVELACDDPGVVADLNTPDDYERWAGTRFG
jgi:molybdenum cofactor cytidylyltransferase